MLTLVFKNILRNKRRTLLTIGSIFVSLFLFTVLENGLATMDRVEQRADEGHRMCVHHKMSLLFSLPESYGQKLKAFPGVLAVCPFQWYGGYYRDPKYFFSTLAVDEETLTDVWGDQLEMPREHWESFKKNRQGAVVGNVIANKFGWKVGDRVRLTGTVYPIDLELVVSAIPTKSFDQSALLLHRKYQEQAMGNPGIVSNFWIKVDRSESIPGLMQRIDDSFANSPYETLAETERSFADNMMGMLGDIRKIVGGIGFIVVLTICLVAANSVAMSVRERITEMAVLKAIGFRPRHVLALVLGESMLVSTIGGALGCLAAYELFQSAWFAAQMGPLGALFVAQPTVVVMGIGIAMAIGLAAGIVPGVSAARLHIVDALRRVA